MLSEIRRSLNIMNGVMAGCGLFGLSVSHFLAISIIGMVKGELSCMVAIIIIIFIYFYHLFLYASLW